MNTVSDSAINKAIATLLVFAITGFITWAFASDNQILANKNAIEQIRIELKAVKAIDERTQKITIDMALLKNKESEQTKTLNKTAKDVEKLLERI